MSGSAGGDQTTSQFLCFLADVLVTFECWRGFHSSGSMRLSLAPTQLPQVGQLIQDATSMRAVARRVAVSVSVVSRAWRRYQETGIRRRGGGQQPSSRTATSAFVQGGAGGALARALQNDLQQATNVHVSAQTVRNRLHEGGMRA